MRPPKLRSWRSKQLSGVDTDTIISGVALAIVTMLGLIVWLQLSVRDRIGKVDKRIEAHGQRVTKLIEWIENNSPRKRSK